MSSYINAGQILHGNYYKFSISYLSICRQCSSRDEKKISCKLKYNPKYIEKRGWWICEAFILGLPCTSYINIRKEHKTDLIWDQPGGY